MPISIQEYSGVGRISSLNPVLNYLFDDALGSGVLRAVKPSDLAATSITISNATISGTNGNCLQANTARRDFYVQNLGTGNPLFLKFGSAASNTSFSVALKPGNVADDGIGAYISDDVWKGVISVSGVTPRYIAWERS
jgi:hypothetical protein